jgi:hypothetical protein
MILLLVILFVENILAGSCCTTYDVPATPQVNNSAHVNTGQSQTERQEEITEEAATSQQKSNQHIPAQRPRTYADTGRSETVTLTKRQVQQILKIRVSMRRS